MRTRFSRLSEQGSAIAQDAQLVKRVQPRISTAYDARLEVSRSDRRWRNDATSFPQGQRLRRSIESLGQRPRRVYGSFNCRSIRARDGDGGCGSFILERQRVNRRPRADHRRPTFEPVVPATPIGMLLTVFSALLVAPRLLFE